jgi:hypothetical protein
MKATPGRVEEMQMAKPSKEVERKWLVLDPPALSKFKRVKIVQGYLTGIESETEVRHLKSPIENG